VFRRPIVQCPTCKTALRFTRITYAWMASILAMVGSGVGFLVQGGRLEWVVGTFVFNVVGLVLLFQIRTEVVLSSNGDVG
jgi:hypothetical protein